MSGAVFSFKGGKNLTLIMDEEFLHLFEESPALRLMRGRLGSFVVGFFLQTFKQWGVVAASEEDLGAPEDDVERGPTLEDKRRMLD